jgi:acyl carrier protein
LSRDHIEMTLLSLVVDVLDLQDHAQPGVDSDLFEEFGLDSAAILTLVTAIEEEFDIELEDEDITRAMFTSVRAMAECVRKR